MIKVQIPYKSHDNKRLWDYMTLACTQLNNINLSSTLDDIKNSYDNVMFVVVDYSNDSISFLVSLSHVLEDKEHYVPYTDIWMSLFDTCLDYDTEIDKTKLGIFCFDIKKYNFVLSFAEDYKNRDNINFYIDNVSNKLYYCISDTNYVDLSPLTLSSTDYDYIKSSYRRYKHCRLSGSSIHNIMSVDSVDGNSFLLPYMAYKDFLNFATYSVNNKSYIIAKDNDKYFANILTDGEDYRFYCESFLRNDKFTFDEDFNSVQVPSGLWQILVMLQNIKYWNKLYYHNNGTASLIFNIKNPSKSTVCHVFNSIDELDYDSINLNLDKYTLVGKQSASELFKINKLYSNANRICHFDYSKQVFTGNGYIFNDDKLEMKSIDLENKIDTTLPLKITFTEVKHYIGSDLSQKSYILKTYTDGIRVMLERYDKDETHLDCRVIFDKAMSKKNQNLTI